MDRLREILQGATVPLRRGNPAERPVDTRGLPHESEYDHLEKVDCYYIYVGIHTEAAELCREEFVQLVYSNPVLRKIESGLGYREAAKELGNYRLALSLFALGEYLGLWQTITPVTLGFSFADASRLAEKGFIIATGFHTWGACNA